MEGKELYEETRKRFPPGTKCISTDGEEFTVSLTPWIDPLTDVDNWYEGIYYHGSSRKDILAMGDGDKRGYYLMLDGKWATVKKKKLYSNQFQYEVDLKRAVNNNNIEVIAITTKGIHGGEGWILWYMSEEAYLKS